MKFSHLPRMRAPFCCLLAVVGFSVLKSSARAQEIIAIEEKFDGEDLDVMPANVARGRGFNPAGDIRVVGASSTPADPFGPAANRSLLLEKQADDGAVIALSAEAKGQPPGKKGTWKFRFVPVQDGDTFDIARGGMSLRSADQVAIALQTLGEKFDYIGADGIGQSFDQKVHPNEINEVEITFDLEAGKFQGKLNGEPLTLKGENSFPVRSEPDGVNIVVFAAGARNGTPQRFFFDDVELRFQGGGASLDSPKRGLQKRVRLLIDVPGVPSDGADTLEVPARVHLSFDEILKKKA